MLVHTNVTYCTRQSLTIHWNQFACPCSVRVKPSKGSSVWVTPIQPTGGDNNRKWMWLLTGCESYQYSSRLECVCLRVCDQHVSFCLCLLPSMSRSKFRRAGVYFCSLFLLIALGMWCLCHTLDVGRILEARDLKKSKSKLNAIQTKVHTNCWIRSASWCVLRDTGTHT